MGVKSKWKEQLDLLISPMNKTHMDYVFSVFELQLGDKNEDMGKLFKVVGLENFIKIINLFSGKTIEYVTISELKEFLTISLLFYYRENLKLSWNEIWVKAPFIEQNPVGWGMKIGKLNNYIKKHMLELFKKIDGQSYEQ